MLRIDNACINDVDDIKILLNRIWKDTYKSILSEGVIKTAAEKWQSKERLKAQIESEAELFILGRNEKGQIVGLATSSIIEENVVYVKRLYVDLDAQRKGVGSKLLKYTENYYKKAKLIRLDAAEGNSRAIEFYKKHGFKIVKKEKEMILTDSIDVFVMEKLI